VLLTVGRITRAQGVRGEVVVDVRTDDPDARFVEGAVLATEPERAGPLTIGRLRWQGTKLVVRFRNVPDRDAAEALRGVRLVVDVPDDERPEDPDEFYDHQLVGLQAVTVGGEAIGTVHEVLHLPAHDVLAIRRADDSEVLVPFVSEIVPDVDLDAKRILVDPPGGLLDLDRTE